MCEQFIARASDPFRLDELWPFTERLERFGLAGFGWGAAWVDGIGGLVSHRTTAAFRDDPATRGLGAIETTAVLVHLRRPSKLSTLTLDDTQPFVDPGGRFAFSHNGDLADVRTARAAYQAEGRIHGRADTEVGARWLEDAWATGTTAGPHDADDGATLLRSLHERFGGQANLATIEPDGTVRHYAGNRENPVFRFRLGRIGIASTGLYSIDRSLFRLVAPDATDRHVVPAGRTVSLDPDGAATAA